MPISAQSCRHNHIGGNPYGGACLAKNPEMESGMVPDTAQLPLSLERMVDFPCDRILVLSCGRFVYPPPPMSENTCFPRGKKNKGLCAPEHCQLAWAVKALEGFSLRHSGMSVEAPMSMIKILEGASNYVSLASGFPRSGTVLPAQTRHPEACLLSMVALV